MDDLSRTVLQRLRMKHWRTIEVLGRVESMRGAAGELNMTQPAITKMLQDIENLLDVRLFERRSTGIVPTPIGQAVLAYARKTVSDVERLSGLISNLKFGGHGSLRLGAIMASLNEYLPKALATLKAERPLMAIHLMTAPSNQLLDALNNGSIDMAIARLTDAAQKSHLDFEPLLDEEVWVFSNADYALPKSQDLTLAKLHQEPWVLQSPMTPLRQLVQESFARLGLAMLPNWIETDSIYTTLNLVKRANMIAALPRAIVAEQVAAGELTRLPVSLSGNLGKFGIVLHKDNEATENIRLFRRILQRTAAESL